MEVSKPYYVWVWTDDKDLAYLIGKGKRGGRTEHKPRKGNNPPIPPPHQRKVISWYPTEQLAMGAMKKLYGRLVHDCGMEQMEAISRYDWFDSYEFSSLERDKVDDVRTTNKTPVQAFNKDGTSVGIYESVGDAAAFLGIGKPNIFMCLSGKQKTAGGFIFKRV